MKNPKKNLLLASIFAGGMVFGSAASAAVQLSQGESALYNFDFTPLAAGFTVTSGFVAIGADQSFGPPDVVKIEFFDALGGAGTSAGGCEATVTTCAVPSIGFDGVFSVLFTASVGAFSINPFAQLSDGGDKVQASGALVRTSGNVVPEPGTLTLLGLAGLAAARRRRQK
jgi:hypothetical protein